MYSQEIIIQPAPVPSHMVISRYIFPRLHMLFVNNGSHFGISFPAFIQLEHQGMLGNVVEVLCKDKERLASLNLVDVLSDIKGIKVRKGIHEVEDYVLFRRVRRKSYASRVRRMMARGGSYAEELRHYIEIYNKRTNAHAYIDVKSLSTGDHFRLYIEPAKPLKTGVDFSFNAYGLVVTENYPRKLVPSIGRKGYR